MPKEVVFEGGGGGPARESAGKGIQTGRYDRKAIRARLELEEWMDEQLRSLYNLGDTDLSADQELDLDLVWDEDADDRDVFVKNLLGGVKDKAAVDAFVAALLKRMSDIKA
eukprot:m.174510 g.174510  ORF g.174510 m.174510 type:complete len:111 (+) comp13839_c0_seq1:32-364(+)